MGKWWRALEGLVKAPPWAACYRDKTVLVTGHSGFKGGWLASWLKILGARVIGFSLPPESDRPSLFKAANISQNMVSVFGDIRDFASVLGVFQSHTPEIVFHMAAQPLVRRSYREPVQTFATNVMGSVHVLEAVRNTPSVRVVVNITSDKCYENRERALGYREDEPMGGRDPYSSSKGCAELITAAYRRSFFAQEGRVALASTRSGNVVGGGDWSEDRLVPDILRALSEHAPVSIRNPEAIRPWQHVLEPLSGYLLLGERLWRHGREFAEAWNFGPLEEDMISVRELATKFIELWGGGRLEIEHAKHGFHEAHFLRLDCTKARNRLGWQPTLRLEQALEMTIEWYRAFLKDSSSVGGVIIRQIQRYMEARA